MPHPHCIRKVYWAPIAAIAALTIACQPVVRAPIPVSARTGPGVNAQLILAQIAIWNRIAQPVTMEILLDDSLVYSGLISVPKIDAQIGGGTTIQFLSGSHKLVVRDATRDISQDTVFVTGPDWSVPKVINVRIEPAGPRIVIGAKMVP